MGKKDAVSKHYMSKNEIFADAVNFYFFDGREKVKPEDLENGDAEELELLYGKHAAVHAVVEQEKNREKGKRKHKRRDSDLISVPKGSSNSSALNSCMNSLSSKVNEESN